MLPLAITIPLVVGLASAAGGFYVGHEFATGNIAKDKVHALEEQLSRAEQAAERLAKQTEKEVAVRAKLSTVTSTNTETIIRETLQPTYTDCRITPDSMRAFTSTIDEINRAISGAGTVRTDPSSK